MSADLLRRAAAEMRGQHGPEHERHVFWHALADLLDKWAWMVGLDPDLGRRVGGDEIVAVARAYLREELPAPARAAGEPGPVPATTVEEAG